MAMHETVKAPQLDKETDHKDAFRAAKADMFLMQLEHHGRITLNLERYRDLKRCGLSRSDVRTAVNDLLRQKKVRLTSYFHGVTVELVEEGPHV
jgi:hypothetical protein